MMLERIHKAHVLLLEQESIRHRITVIGTITNPYLTASYEADLMERLIETEMLIDGIKKISFPTESTLPFSSDAPREV